MISGDPLLCNKSRINVASDSEYLRLCGVVAPAFHVSTSVLIFSNVQYSASFCFISVSSQSCCSSPSHVRSMLSAPSDTTWQQSSL